MDRSLWEASGHWEKFREHMFTSETADGRIFALKPMNCPGHVQVFQQGLTSYLDLPLRLAEFSASTPTHPSCTLRVLLRSRDFRQSEAHNSCPKAPATSAPAKRCRM